MKKSQEILSFSINLINLTLLLCSFKQLVSMMGKFTELELLKMSIFMQKAKLSEKKGLNLVKCSRVTSPVHGQFSRLEMQKSEQGKEIPVDFSKYRERQMKHFPKITKNYKTVPNWQQEYKNRQRSYKEMCKMFSRESDFNLESMADYAKTTSFIDTQHKILYCELPKCGCTHWKNVMLKFSSYDKPDQEVVDFLKSKLDRMLEKMSSKTSSNKTIRTLDKNTHWSHLILEKNYPKVYENVYRNGTYFKFIFVRHPLDRILSAFLDKIERKFFERTVDEDQNLSVLDTIRSMDSNLDLRKIDLKNLEEKFIKARLNLSKHAFQVFLAYLIDREISQIGGDTVRHWKRYYDLCQMCQSNWDFIGKLESIQRDSQYLIQKLGFDTHKISYGESKSHHLVDSTKAQDTTGSSYGKDLSSSDDKIIRYFSHIPKFWITEIYKIYETDFLGFGYEIPSWLWPHLSE